MSFLLSFLSRISLCLLFIGLVFPGYALDLEPRKWNHIPLGTSFAGGAYVYTEADIFLDPTLLIENGRMKMNTWAGKYVHAFELFDKSARIDIAQAYQEAKWTGLLDGANTSVKRSGLSDTLVRFAVNLHGAPPLSGEKFAAYRSKMKAETIVGAALVVRLPTGNYKENKLLNLGQNRFVFRPQVGVVHTRGEWTMEVTGEAAFFTENDEFYKGTTLEQKPLYITHAHLINSISPGEWASVSIGYDYGGENTVNGVDKGDRKQNVAWAVSYSYPINRQTGIKVAYIGTRTKESTGFDSETLAIGGAFAW